MRRLCAQLIVAGVTAFAIGVAYRYAWDDPSEASFVNYMRSGVHGMGLAASGLGAHLYFNSRLSGRLRRWPLLAEIALRAVVMAIAVSATAAGLQVALYDRRAEGTWYFSAATDCCDYLCSPGPIRRGLRVEETDRGARAPQRVLGEWWQHLRSRSELESLDESMLRDIGLL